MIDEQREVPKTVKLYNPNAEIVVSQSGVYRLVKVRLAAE
jgi:hypothetical protein